MNNSNPDYDNLDFDYEIPSYIYGYYNGEEANMPDNNNDWAVGPDSIIPPLRQRKRKYGNLVAVKSPLDINNTTAGEDFKKEMKEENETIKISSPEDSNDFFERLKNRKLERAGFPNYDKCINNVVLISVGDSERVYEALLSDVSLRGRSIRIEPSSRKNGATTISEKMAGWWLIDKLSFIDTIDICNKQFPEKELPRAIV